MGWFPHEAPCAGGGDDVIHGVRGCDMMSATIVYPDFDPSPYGGARTGCALYITLLKFCLHLLLGTESISIPRKPAWYDTGV